MSLSIPYKNSEEQIVFTIARMNPPTPGHKFLIKTMFEKALELNLTQINIILSSTVDNQKNPIECEEKRMIIYNSLIDVVKKELKLVRPEFSEHIDRISVEIVCMNDQTDIEMYGSHPIYSKVNYILADFYGYPRIGLKMFLVIGEDRINSYDFLIEFLMNKNPSIELEVVPLSRPVNAMSASYLRGLALSSRDEDKEEFVHHLRELGMNDFDIESIYNQIKDNIKQKKPKVAGSKSKRKRKNKKDNKKSKTKKTRKHRHNKK